MFWSCDQRSNAGRSERKHGPRCKLTSIPSEIDRRRPRSGERRRAGAGGGGRRRKRLSVGRIQAAVAGTWSTGGGEDSFRGGGAMVPTEPSCCFLRR
jgi:hypothetical protein